MFRLCKNIIDDCIHLYLFTYMDKDFTRPGDHVDAHLSEKQALGKCDIIVAGTYDLVRIGYGFCTGRKRSGGLAAARAIDVLHPGYVDGGESDVIVWECRRPDMYFMGAGYRCRTDCHQPARRTKCRAGRHIYAHFLKPMIYIFAFTVIPV